MKSLSFAYFLVSLVVTQVAYAAGAEAEKPYGIAKRTPWTTSNFRGRPEPPPPYKPVRIYPQVNFDRTTLITSAPGTDRLFVGERGGKIFTLPADRNATEATLFLDTAPLVAKLNAANPPKPLAFESCYSMTFDPDFEKNRYCYVMYVVKPADNAGRIADGSRVSRFKVSDTDPPVADPASEELMISWLQGGHNGGCIKFGHDGYLYVSTGDGGVAFPPDGLKSGQDMTTLCSKVLRIDVHHPSEGRAYSIPRDNPFVRLKDARAETWSYGMRQPWKMSFDRQTGELWVGDVGWELWELVYRVRKGDNYGWSIVEGPQPVHPDGKRGPTPIVPAALEIPHTDGASITGGFVYRGKKFPELDGHYIFGDWETRRMWGLPTTKDGVGERYEIIDPIIRIVDFAEDKDGELYLLDHYDGAIYILEKNDFAASENRFPRKLSETGLFQDTARQQPAAGVLPFSVNVEQWSDFATAERFFAVPQNETIHVHRKPLPVPNSQFSRAVDPANDMVLVKTLSLELEAGKPESRRRIETQTLHYDGREWQAYTYEWNDEQTDAVLVDRQGKNRTFTVVDPNEPGGKRTQTWRFSSRGECLRCHNPWSEHALAFNLAQLNRDHDYASHFPGGATDNQIRTLRHLGILTDVVEPVDPYDPYAKPEPIRTLAELPKLTPTHDESADVALRARSYLHVNCGHCHRFNGGGSSYIYLTHDLPLLDTKTVGVKPTQGTFGIEDAELIAAGDPYRSALYFRLSKTGPGHMPHLGAKYIDPRAVKVVHDWIAAIPRQVAELDQIDKLIALDEPTALKAQLENSPHAAWLNAKKLAKRQQREVPNETELAEGKRQQEQRDAEAATKREAQRAELIKQFFSKPEKAVMLADATRAGRLPESIRELVLATALNEKTDAAVRDLFEPFVPESRRVERLGDVIIPQDILDKPGDLERGRKLFHESTVVQCRSCHRIGGKGIELGPDLDGIGKKYDRAKLLDNIVKPSATIDPKYVMYVVETSDGQIYTGLLVERNDKAVVLKDAKNKPQRIPAADIEGLFPQTKSFMPEMLLRDFTAQQAADLLEYLSSLKAGPDPTPTK